MIELAGAAAAAPTEDGRLAHEASTGAADPTLGGLVFDDTMAGLTLDEVSVVLVGDHPVLVPLTRELAERSGFTVIDVSDESLLSLGVGPRRPPVEIVEQDLPIGTPSLGAPVIGDESSFPPVGVRATSPFATTAEPVDAVNTWATWPSPDPAIVGTWGTGSTPVDRWSETGEPSSADVSTPSSSPILGDRPTRTAQSLNEGPVETARPINSMAASHLDWEPAALGWPYIDRRLDLATPDPATPETSANPRSLASGRPVNGVGPSELVIHGDTPNADDVIIELRGAAALSLSPLTIDLDAVSFTVVSGPRGSGKTSLLRLLAGFDAPTQGAGVVGGEELLSIPLEDRAAREAISAGFVPQLPFFVPDLTVAENVELPLLASDVSSSMARGVAEETLRSVGLATVIGLPASVLSGSETRLAAVARALVSSPEIVFADEPFAGLSDDDALIVLGSLQDVVADGGTVIIACTDPRVRLYGVRQLVLEAGTVVRDEIVSTIS